MSPMLISSWLDYCISIRFLDGIFVYIFKYKISENKMYNGVCYVMGSFSSSVSFYVQGGCTADSSTAYTFAKKHQFVMPCFLFTLG